jgi:hypothetical protein
VSHRVQDTEVVFSRLQGCDHEDGQRVLVSRPSARDGARRHDTVATCERRCGSALRWRELWF